MRDSIRIYILGLLLLLSGCGTADPGPKAVIEKVVPVSGTLTYKGQPLESYKVSFIPTDERRPASGVTDAEGKFTLGTNAAGDGAPPGMCKVAVVFEPPTNDTADGLPIDNPNLLPKPKVAIPAKYSSAATSGLTQEVPADGLTDLKIDLQ